MLHKQFKPRLAIVRVVAVALSVALALGSIPAPALAEAADEADSSAIAANTAEVSNAESEAPEEAEASESELEGANLWLSLEGAENPLGQEVPEAALAAEGGAIPIDIDVPSITEGRVQGDAMVVQGSLPEAYSSLDNGLVTPMKDQSIFGICWAFSTIAALESSLIATGQASADTVDLSERHLAYFNYHQQDDVLNNLTGDGTYPKGTIFGTDELGSDPYLISGGNFYSALNTLASWEGAVDEGAASYDELIEVRRNYAEQIEQWGMYPYGYRITSAEQGDAFLQATALDPSLARDANTAYLTGYRLASFKTQEDVGALKQAIMDYGGVTTQLNTQAEFRKDEYETSSGKRIVNIFDYNPNTEIDHEVEIIGWDDNYDRFHFGSHELYNRPNSSVSPGEHTPLTDTLTIDNSDGDSNKYVSLRADHQQEGRYKISANNCNVSAFRLTPDGEWVAYVGSTAENSSGEADSNSLIVESFGNDTHLLSVTVNPGCTATVSIERVGDLDLSDTPERNGAWLAKNSWGGVHETGYVWISYEDVCVSPENGMVGFALASTEKPYDNNYQYDGSTGTKANSVASGGSIANVYEAKANEGEAEELKAVSLSLGDANVDYEIQVYANPKDPSDPTSGTPLLCEPTTGRTNFMGYYTIELNEPVYMREGNSYAMVATLSHADGSDVAYSVESSLDEDFMYTEAAVSEGQSFERDTANGAWDDLALEECDEGDQSRCCARIKAFTDNIAISDMPVQSLQDADISIDEQAYTGTEVVPDFSVRLAGRTLVAGIDFDASFDNNVNIGTATVTVTGKDRYTDSKSATFSITPRPVTVTGVDASKTYGEADPTFSATVEGTLGSDTVSYQVGRTAGEDAGTYAITPTGEVSQGNYVVAYEPGTLTINPLSIAGATIDIWNTSAYSGKAIEPSMRVIVNGKALKKGTDYTVSYRNNVNAGKATAVIRGKGNYADTESATFSIPKAESEVSLAAQTKTYSGKALAYSGKVTRSGSGGKVTYKYYADAKCTRAATPKAAGTYWVRATLAADANHKGATSGAARLTVSRAKLSGASIARVADQAYTAKAVRPSPKVTLAGTTLKAGTDYTLSYRNNTKAGSATVTVTGRGNYAGAKSVTFKIVAPSVQYRTHVQTYGDQAWRRDGAVSGTFGESKRLEGIWVKLPVKPVKGSIQCRTHVQTYGWQAWRDEGKMSGTSGEAKRLEAIQIRLTGNMAKSYDVYYRVHAQRIGWMGWAKNGAQAGTAGFSYRLEGIQILLLPKGSRTPSANYGGYRQATSQPFRKA